MSDGQLIVGIERLRDDLTALKANIRQRYPKPDRQVVADDVKRTAAKLAESWVVDFSQRPEVAAAIGSGVLADLTVHFQRILSYSEHATQRSRYDTEIKAILEDFTLSVVVPLKRLNANPNKAALAGAVDSSEAFKPTCFIGQSFSDADLILNQTVRESLEAVGFKVVTGEKPKADSISEKVKRDIDDQWLFVAIFSRRDKIARKAEWTTSQWVMDEKAYAIGRRKKLILLKEKGVGSIGGLQGDYEYLEFEKTDLAPLITKLLQVFRIVVTGLR